MTFCRTWWERRCKGQFVCAKHLHFFGHLSNHFELTRKNSKNNRHKNWQIYKSTRKFLISKFFVFRKFSNFREIFMKFRENFEILLLRRNENFFLPRIKLIQLSKEIFSFLYRIVDLPSSKICRYLVFYNSPYNVLWAPLTDALWWFNTPLLITRTYFRTLHHAWKQ